MRTAIPTLLASAALCALAPAAAQSPMEIEDLFKVRSVGGAAIAPDGNTVAYTLYRVRDVTAGEKDGTTMQELKMMRACMNVSRPGRA